MNPARRRLEANGYDIGALDHGVAREELAEMIVQLSTTAGPLQRRALRVRHAALGALSRIVSARAPNALAAVEGRGVAADHFLTNCRGRAGTHEEHDLSEKSLVGLVLAPSGLARDTWTARR